MLSTNIARANGTLTLRASIVAAALCLVTAPAASAQDQIGFYWDQAYTQMDTVTFAPGEIISGHLVIHDPTSSGGILAWECEVDVDGPAFVTQWLVAGQSINAETPPRFAVGLVSPLPPSAATEVATIQLLVTDIAPLTISLKPLFFASIPGEMSYLGGDNPNQLVAMATTTGEPLVATVNKDAFIADVSPIALNLGTHYIGGPGNTLSVRVSNIGGGILPLVVSLTDSTQQFSLGAVSGTVDVIAGQFVDIPVTFMPTNLLPTDATLNLGPNVPSVALFGIGREPIQSWTEPDDVDFGDVMLDGMTDTYGIAITNTGEAPLDFNIDWLTPCTSFTIGLGGGNVTVQPGAMTFVRVDFFPVLGQHNCTLSFGPGFPEVEVSALGFAGTPLYSFNVNKVDFPSTPLGESRTQLIRVTNNATNGLIIDPMIVPANPAFSLSGNAQFQTLNPGQSTEFYLHFAPLALGTVSPDLVIANGLVPIQITGIGGPEDVFCLVAEDSLLFQVTTQGATDSSTLSVTNTSSSSLFLEPTIDSAFYSVSPLSASIPVGQTANFQVDFTPTVAGIETATLVLGPGACSTVDLYGVVGPNLLPGESTLGFFFDTAYQATLGNPGDGITPIPVYLALANATDASGVGGWECRVKATGGADFVSWDLEGSAINAADPNDDSLFTVGIALDPLPYAPNGTLLATFQLLIYDPNPGSVTLELHPKWNPTLPGLMSWVPWSDLGVVLPMQTVTGNPTVAWFDLLTAVDDPSLPSARTQLLGNAPNPFNPQTRIRFHLAEAGRARVTIYDVTGRKIRSLSDEQWSAGEHALLWRGRDDNGRQVASGAYYVRLEAAGQIDHRKIMMLK